MNTNEDENFGQLVKRLRLDAKLGLRELAILIKKSPGYLSDIERGEVPPPKEGVILDIARALNVDKDELLSAASKVDPELSSYISKDHEARIFFRKARDMGIEGDDWGKLAQMAEIANLGKGEKKK